MEVFDLSTKMYDALQGDIEWAKTLFKPEDCDDLIAKKTLEARKAFAQALFKMGWTVANYNQAVLDRGKYSDAKGCPDCWYVECQCKRLL